MEINTKTSLRKCGLQAKISSARRDCGINFQSLIYPAELKRMPREIDMQRRTGRALPGSLVNLSHGDVNRIEPP